MLLKAVTLDPTSKEAHHGLATSLSRTGRLDLAEKHYRRAIEIDPAWAQPHNLLGVVLGKTGRLQEAVAQFKQAVALAPDDQGARKNLAMTEALLAKQKTTPQPNAP